MLFNELVERILPFISEGNLPTKAEIMDQIRDELKNKRAVKKHLEDTKLKTQKRINQSKRLFNRVKKPKLWEDPRF